MTISRLFLPAMAALILAAGVTHTAMADAPSDAALAEAVKAKLTAKNPEFMRSGQVEVSGGVVTLKGAVVSPGVLTKALQEAGSVPGVLKVVNRVVRRQ